MNDPKQARIVAVVTLYIAALIVLVEGIGSEKQFLKATSWVPLAIMLVLTTYERWLWKIGPVGVPILAGTWRVALTSSYEDPNAPGLPIVRTGYLICIQTATQLTVRLLTAESSSVSLASKLQRRGDSQYELSWVYQNTPRALIQDQSPVHFGSVIAENLSGRRIQSVSGSYFTSRRTIGEFVASDRKRKIASSMGAATILFGDQPG